MEKPPSRKARGGAEERTGLEFISDARDQLDGVLLVRISRRATTKQFHAVAVIPAEFETAEDVFPEIVLDRRGEFPNLRVRAGDIGREILAASMEAQFFGGLKGGVAADHPLVVNGARRLVMVISVIETGANLQSGDGCVDPLQP